MKSFWKGLLAVLAFVFGVYEVYDVWFAGSDYGDSIVVNGTEIFYSDVDTTQVRELANYLEASEFSDGTEKSVRLQKSERGYLFGGVYDESVWNDSAYVVSAAEFAKELSLHVFDSEPVVFQICDDEFNVQNEALFDISEFPYGWELAFGEMQLFFTPRVDYVTANRLGEFLKSQGYTDYSSTVQIDQSDSAYHYNQVTLEDYWFDEEYLATLEEDANEVSDAVFDGARVIYTLCDDELRPKSWASSN